MALKGKYFTVSEVAKEMGVTRQTISRWIAQGKFIAEAVGREKIISEKQVRRMRRLNATSLAKRVIAKLSDLIKQSFYSEDDKIRVEGDDFIVTKSDGTMEKVEIPKFTIKIDDKTKVAFIELTEIIRTPYKKGDK